MKKRYGELEPGDEFVYTGPIKLPRLLIVQAIQKTKNKVIIKPKVYTDWQLTYFKEQKIPSA